MATDASPALRSLLNHVTRGREDSFLSQTGIKLPQRFRFNGLKHTRSFQESLLAAEGFDFQRSDSSTDVFECRPASRLPGKSLAHCLGDIYIQDLASMLPAKVLDPSPGDRILDLCAAPGSKTTQLAELMQNRGVIIANDSSNRRIRSLVFNLRRLGASNVCVLKDYGELFGNQYFEMFDGVLLDAPCSALGTLHKSPEVLEWWEPSRSERLAVQQRSLIQSGLKALKPGGVLVYSTCTVTPQENEEILQFVLDRFPVEIEEIHLPRMKIHPGLTDYAGTRYAPALARAVRIYPHDNPCEGFFIARLRKTDSFGRARFRRTPQWFYPFLTERDDRVAPELDRLRTHFDWDASLFEPYCWDVSSELSCVCGEAYSFPFHEKPVRAGLPVAHLRRFPARLTTEGTHLAGAHVRQMNCELEDWADLFRYANRVDLNTSMPGSGQIIVRFRGEPIGHALLDGGRLLSRFPRTGWTFG
ncbi:MAG: RsmB/NOP family class I SAM-dependent RNA methyltransferase [Acidobacteriota bacterium]